MNPSDPGRRAGDDVLDPSLVGVLPVIPPESSDRQPRNNAATAATAAGVRAFTAQAIAFYFRAPAKAFFRMRVDYLAYARNLQQQNHSYMVNNLPGTATNGNGKGNGQVARQTWWQWCRSVVSRTTPGVLVSAVRHSGWRVIPDQVLPPLIANVSVGAVLYTSYLQILGQLHEDSGKATKRVYPPPRPSETFTAGLLAGALQSVIAAPLDAIQARFDRGGQGPELINGSGRPQSMWSFSYAKLREIGMRGIFAGWSLSLAKDSLGSAVFFSSFEYVKAQSYYSFIAWYYGDLSEDVVNILSRRQPGQDKSAHHAKTIQPHYSIEPAFLMLAGISASFAQQVVLHPLGHVQVEHWEHLEYLDAQARKIRKYTQANAPKSKWQWKMIHAYYHAYRETWAQCVAQAKVQEGSGPNAMRRWLYRGFWWSTIRQVPSTSAGLVIFELVRRKYGLGGEPVRINKDGYDILLA
ncbi:mitochondrial carrier [Cryphonectria parasitica EP155]|uniref:Mitochondrial carrier n=1 Tax=Cryphonectria parasitica (strain ATCC 38755 / EP155) TaxID=660469 RepID=A0A9P4YA41_CRYP1|nr:mitochondrial carrier [Cryphonectria parasitica EP155]KAF3769794.1 mitochondrial carrier [Cryphonectria parasitica EP155]